MENFIIAIAEALQAKNRGFSMYRYPNEQGLRLAIEEEALPQLTDCFFLMTPFSSESQAPEARWAVVPPAHINEGLLAYIEKLTERDPVTHELPSEISYSEYQQRFQSYLNEINEKQIGKAILSRVILEDKPQGFREIDVFRKLTQRYPDTFVYLAFHQRVGTWMGASPELLLDKNEKMFSVMALAGTQRYVENRPVTWDKKDQDEHEMVVEHVESILNKHEMNILSKNGPMTWHLKRLLHLRTDFVVNESTTVALMPFLKDLHPTPAIGGLPVQKALECIEKHEHYDRTYYSGFLGETDFKNSCHLYVNLRCMQIEHDKIAIYAGGGITASSVLEKEWEETILKSRTMLDIIE